jgi:N-acetylmuramoyl-L-alanine amidase
MGMALALLLMAGCHTARVTQPVVTEVTLSPAQPVVLPSPVGVPETPAATNLVPLPSPAVAARTNLPAPRLPPPPGGWVPLENWCQAIGAGKPRKIGSDHYAVTTPQGVAVFQAGSQALRWDGLSVWLGFAPRYVQGQLHLHWLDVQKTLEPLLAGPLALAKPGRVVVIDPGHGGSDSGTQGTKRQLEKDFTLDWARRVELLLRTNGWQVFLTRTNDSDVSLNQRVALADTVGADLFVSLHFNGLAADTRHSGLETFCTTPTGMPSTVKRNGEDNPALDHPGNAFDSDNLRYALGLHRELLAATHAADGGVRRARFITVLRAQHCPAVLIEGGFLSNPTEAGRIATTAYRQKLAEAVARSLQ